jgi:hypothetical protein
LRSKVDEAWMSALSTHCMCREDRVWCNKTLLDEISVRVDSQ